MIYVQDTRGYPERHKNIRTSSFSFDRTIAPVMGTRTLEVGDVIVLSPIKISYNQVVELKMRHFGTNGTDATLVLDFSLSPYAETGDRLATDANGDTVVIDPNYFATALTFDAVRNTDFNPSRINSFTESRTVGENITGSNVSGSYSFALVAVVDTLPTGTIDLVFKGTTRGY